MKPAIITILAIVLSLVAAGSLRADTIWTSGHHEIFDGDEYLEIWMYNGSTADMWGGDVFQLGALDSSIFNMFGGAMDYLLVRHDSTVNIHGGILSDIVIYNENGWVNLYAYDVAYHPTSGGEGWMDGKYVVDDEYFSFNVDQVDLSHISVIPEPATLLLLGLGAFFLRRRN